jgi:hypothetical protein
MVSALDVGVGMVLQALQTNGIDDRTLVFFLSDNGGPTSENGSLNTPLRGGKGDVYEGGIRVPFAVRWPGGLPTGVVYDQPVSSMDIFPTAIALAGGTMPTNRSMDGVNLMPYLLGETNAPPHKRLFWRTSSGATWAIREGSWKWLLNSKLSNPSLGSLQPDGRGEYDDYSSAEPDRVTELEALFAAWDAHMIEPLWGPGAVESINGAVTLADDIGYRVTKNENAYAYTLITPRHLPDPSADFALHFSMQVFNESGYFQNGFVVLGETDNPAALIRVGLWRGQNRIVVTELENGAESELSLDAADLPVGLTNYEIYFDHDANMLSLRYGTHKVTHTLSRTYGMFNYLGYGVKKADARFSDVKINTNPYLRSK